MRNIRKAIVLLLSAVIILAFASCTFASTIQPKNISSDNTSSDEGNTSSNEANTTGNETENSTGNTAANSANNTSNAANNTSGLNTSSSNSASNRSTITTTNSSENIPHTGSEDSLNLALFLLLAVVLGMFSLVQYRRIAKKDE